MIESVKQAIALIKEQESPTREALQTALIWSSVVNIIYYIALAVVVWALGRRIIQSVFAGVKEANRERV
jgi:hypothetical protein